MCMRYWVRVSGEEFRKNQLGIFSSGKFFPIMSLPPARDGLLTEGLTDEVYGSLMLRVIREKSSWLPGEIKNVFVWIGFCRISLVFGQLQRSFFNKLI